MYTARRDGGIVRLEDTTGGMVVEIATHLGNLVYRMSVKGHDIVYFPFASPDDYAANPYGWYGIPLLAPWANRLDEPAFHASGRRYAFDLSLGNITPPQVPLHGFLSFAAEWEVTEIGSGETSAQVRSRLDVFRRPAWMKQWPFAHSLDVTHRLHDGALEIATAVVNHGAEPMPIAIGFHPYFQLTDSKRGEWTIDVPARRRWLLSDRLVPTGETESTAGFFPSRPATLEDYNLDDVFDDLDVESGRAVVSVRGRHQQIDVVLGPKYRALVIYAPHPSNVGRGSRRKVAEPVAPPNRLARPDFICLEPMAAITDALNLAHRGVYGELQSVEPGGVWEESFWIRPSGFEV